MWDQPREGTEAHKVKELAEKRKKEAKDKGLDKLLSSVYHDIIRSYPAWIKNDNKDCVHPLVTEATDKQEEIDGQKVDAVSFVMDSKHYKITGKSSWAFMGDDRYYDVVLYVDSKKIFSISETEYSDEYSTTYSPLSVHAYVNDDWVKDFHKIQEHYKKISEERRIKWAEDPNKTRKLKEDFGITDDVINHSKVEGVVYEAKINQFWKKRWFWVLVVLIILALFE